jgi:integrase
VQSKLVQEFIDQLATQSRSQSKLQPQLQLQFQPQPQPQPQPQFQPQFRLQFQPSYANDKTFDQCATEYLARHRYAWSNEKHYKQWESSLRVHVSSRFGNLYAREITPAHVLQVLDPIWIVKTETASRLRVRIERVLAWATAVGYREGDNPARWRNCLQELLPRPSKVKRVQHYSAMPYWEVGAFYQQLETEPGFAARALAFTIITACRSVESLHAKWDEIDLVRRIWTIPGERMKNGRLHRVPLSDAALDVLGSLQARDSVLVFPGRKPGKSLSETSMLTVLHRMQRADMTVHGFRSSFRTWVAERTHYPPEVAELALAHVVGSAVEQAYQRSDLLKRRRALMRDWAAWCLMPNTKEDDSLAL